jgi:hypothetical protein
MQPQAMTTSTRDEPLQHQSAVVTFLLGLSYTTEAQEPQGSQRAETSGKYQMS